MFQTKITNKSLGTHGDDYKGNYVTPCGLADNYQPSGRNSCPIIRLSSTLKMEAVLCVTLKINITNLDIFQYEFNLNQLVAAQIKRADT